MPGQHERDRHVETNIVPFPGRHNADTTPETLTPAVSYFPRSPLDNDLIASLAKVSQQARDAKKCFPLEQRGEVRPLVLRAGLPQSLDKGFFEANDYFGEHGISPEELERLFSSRGGWRYKREDIRGIYEAPPLEVSDMLRDGLSPINNIMDRVLDGLTPDGYNRHGERHPDNVAHGASALLLPISDASSAKNEERERNVIIAGQAHDIGNIFGREPHGHISPRLLKLIIPSVTDDEQSWKTIKRAIILHDSDNLQAVVNSWRLDAPERLERLASYMQPEGLALIIADKVDIGVDRVSDKILAGEIVKDVHAVVNVMGSHQAIEHEGDSLLWQLVYDPDISAAQKKNFRHFIPGWRRRREEGEIDIKFEDWEKMFAGIYTDRLITAAQCSLALYPFISNFKVRMTDVDGAELQDDIVIHRDRLDKDIFRLKQRKQELLRAGVTKYRK